MSFLALFLLVVCSHMGNTRGSLQFTTKEWRMGNRLPIKVAFRGDALPISCQTNNAYATVYLLERKIQNRPWVDAVSRSNGGISRIGQTFLIKKLNIRHSGSYKCIATNSDGDKEELEKGRLMVNMVQRKRIPEIFPNVAIISITLGSNRYITCKTIGAAGEYRSFLTWYRQNEYGVLTKVDASRVIRSEEIVGGNYIDVETLMFKGMRESYVGDYVCERKVYNSNPSRKSIRVETNPIFEFTTKKWQLSKLVSIKMGYIHDSMFISCQTNDPYAKVRLLRRMFKTSPWENVLSGSDGHVVQIGQAFLIKGLRLTDSLYYKCTASNIRGERIELIKGLLVTSVVNKYVTPEIFPNVRILYIPSYTARNVTCKATGIPGIRSFLRWYRKKSRRYVYVDNANIHRSGEDIGGNHVDIETLMFNNFDWNDVGEYSCIRKVPNAKPTSKSIKIEMESEYDNNVS